MLVTEPLQLCIIYCAHELHLDGRAGIVVARLPALAYVSIELGVDNDIKKLLHVCCIRLFLHLKGGCITTKAGRRPTEGGTSPLMAGAQVRGLTTLDSLGAVESAILAATSYLDGPCHTGRRVKREAGNHADSGQARLTDSVRTELC